MKPTRRASPDDVRRIAGSLPGAYEQPSFGGRPAWRTAPRMFAWIREDPEALVVWVPSEQDKVAMIASDSDRFFTTPHYQGTKILLVSLKAIGVDEAREVITDSWRLRAPATLWSRLGTPPTLVKAWDAAH